MNSSGCLSILSVCWYLGDSLFRLRSGAGSMGLEPLSGYVKELTSQRQKDQAASQQNQPYCLPRPPKKTPPWPGVSQLLLLPLRVGEGTQGYPRSPGNGSSLWEGWSISAPPLPGCVTLGKFLHLSELPFPHLFKMGRIILYVRCQKNPSHCCQCCESRDQCDSRKATGAVFSQFGPVVNKC